MSNLPTVYHGVPKDDADTKAVQTALEAITATLNSVPSHLIGRLVSSVLATVCCCQSDPAAAFQAIGEIVGREIGMHLAPPEGSA